MAVRKTDLRHDNKDRLDSLLVKRSIEKTDAYDAEIKKLQEWFDFYDWGINHSREND